MAGKTSGNKNIHKLEEPLQMLWDRLGMGEKAELFAVLGKWDEIVGEKTAAHVKPLHIKNRTLYLKADGASWMNEFQFIRGETIRRINEKLGRPLIKDIRFSN